MRKKVVVTGCSRGLGKRITRMLIEHGYHVIGISRKEPELTILERKSFRFYPCDLVDLNNISATASTIITVEKDIFGLVNNAAIGLDGILPTQHNEDIKNMLNVNLLAPIILAKYLSRPMLLNKNGRIINIGSIVSNTGYRGLSVYASTKGGLDAFTKSLARDLGPANITVNSILPGFMESDMTSILGTDKLQKINARSPLGQIVSFEDVARMALYLLSESGDRITGTTITVDAGNSA